MRWIIIALVIFTIIPFSFAWDDCPSGMTDSSCYYPGDCGRYVDTNNNGICDHSEPAPSDNGTIYNMEPINTNGVIGAVSEELIDEYIGISGSELKSYSIKQICEIYKINPENLKKKLNVDVDDDTTFYELKKTYGISPAIAKEAIFKCMVEEGKIKLNNNNTLVNTAINTQNKEDSFFGKLFEFLFMEVNLKDIIFEWLS